MLDSELMLVYRKHNPHRYRGYETPFADEIYSERKFLEQLQNGDDPAAPFKLFALGRQFELENKLKPDLLALDENGMPWVFEFKRDIAEPAVLSQLLVYGSYIAGQDLNFFAEVYRKTDKHRSLAAAFRGFFKKPLPARGARQVNLVVAAYDFYPDCCSALEFLSESTGITIGRLNVKCVHGLAGDADTTGIKYEWMAYPTPFKLPELPNLEAYQCAACDASQMHMTWRECLASRLLPINQLPGEAPRPGHGLFVYLRNSETQSSEPGEGLAALGVVTGPAFDLFDHEDQCQLSEATFAKLNRLPSPFKVIPMRWLHRREEVRLRACPELKGALTSNRPIELFTLQDAVQVSRLKELIAS